MTDALVSRWANTQMNGWVGWGRVNELRALAAPDTQVALRMLFLVFPHLLEILPEYCPCLSLPALGLGACLCAVSFSISLCAHPVPQAPGSHREVLEQPGSHDVSGHLGEDAPFLIPPSLLVQLLVLSPRTGRGHTCVQSIS